MPDAIDLQSLTSDDRDAVLALDQAAFGFDGRDLDPEADTQWIEWDRAYGASRDGVLGGIYVVFSFGLGVPSRPPQAAQVVPMAGLSWVAVHPDHRRRGLLKAMIGHHLDTVHETGREAVSCLFASEPAIYGRFGYGLSTQSRRMTVPAKTALRPPHGDGGVTTRFEAARPEVHDRIVQEVYAAACLLRPGWTVRPPAHWRRYLQDPVSRRPGGGESLKIVVAEREGRPTGYALLRRTASWGEQAPEGKVSVIDLFGLDPQSEHALWRRVLDLDLMAEVTTPGLPLDHPLTIWASETGTGSRAGHALWTRIVDLDAAFTSRGYQGEVEVVLDVSDRLCPWNAGRWRLAAGGDAAVCERTNASPDLALDIRELGSVYLGGITLAALGAAGLVDELTPGSLAAASAAFRSPLLPITPPMF
jgi:predicted acetyltransferase